MRKIIIMMGAILAITFNILPANAATLTNINGEVKVNKGNGYQTVAKSTFVKVGDKILLGQNSTASILYSNGVSVPVKAGRVAIVKSAFRKPMTVGEETSEAAALVPAINTTTLVVGGLVVGGVVAAIVASNKKKDTPASP